MIQSRRPSGLFWIICTSYSIADLFDIASGAGKGGKGGGCPPMLKKMALVILPNSMRKLGGGGVSISDVKKS